MTHKVHVSLDDKTLRTIDRAAAREGRTRSGIIREMVRAYEERCGQEDTQAAIRAHVLATLHELATADFGAEELPEPEDFHEWRRRLWSEAPRTGAVNG